MLGICDVRQCSSEAKETTKAAHGIVSCRLQQTAPIPEAWQIIAKREATDRLLRELFDLPLYCIGK